MAYTFFHASDHLTVVAHAYGFHGILLLGGAVRCFLAGWALVTGYWLWLCCGGGTAVWHWFFWVLVARCWLHSFLGWLSCDVVIRRLLEAVLAVGLRYRWGPVKYQDLGGPLMAAPLCPCCSFFVHFDVGATRLGDCGVVMTTTTCTCKVT